MITLSMTLVATLLVMSLALVFGVWMARSRRVDLVLRPLLDAGQTIPPFVFLIPAVALFQNGKFTAIDGREMAPSAAHRDMFVHDGKPMPTASQTGPLASGVPGALAAYKIALERCGTIKLARALKPGIDAAAEGFTVTPGYANAIRGEKKHLYEFEGSRAVFFHDDGGLMSVRWDGSDRTVVLAGAAPRTLIAPDGMHVLLVRVEKNTGLPDPPPVAVTV